MGTGHLMRCAALADAIRQRGSTVTFVCRDLPEKLSIFVKNQGFGVCQLPSAGSRTERRQGYEGWLGDSWEIDALQTISALKSRGAIDWLIVDHYGIDHRWEEHLRALGCRILVIDDLGIHKHACDLLLNQNLIAGVHDRYRNLIPEYCRLLAGPQFALLRQEFCSARMSLSRELEQVGNLLVFLGGADPEGATLRVLKIIDGIRSNDLEVTAILGAANPHGETIKRLYGQRNGYKVISQAANMADLMMQADLAIGAGGISTWERACLGLPAIVIAIAENQMEVSRSVAEAGACLYLGAATSLADGELAAGLTVMISNSSLRKSISRVCLDLVDGLGCERVASEILEGTVQVRLARAEDAERVFEWRNAEKTRRFFRDPKLLSLAEHLEWFQRTLLDTKRLLLIGEVDTEPTGVLRYDLDDASASVSIYLNPALHGRGIGARLLAAGERWLQETRPEIQRICAEVLSDNLVSRRLFIGAGFVERCALFEKSIAPQQPRNPLKEIIER
jgi:UDP-2,4-diacetamido-2,4,6-trideoxy-beta-L-altropyranose hydrolase